jgi:hypothetical protein
VYRRSDQALNKNTSLEPRTKKIPRRLKHTPRKPTRHTSQPQKTHPYRIWRVRRTRRRPIEACHFTPGVQPQQGREGPGSSASGRRSPRTPRKAGDGGLTGNTPKPYSAPSPALRRPPPPRRWRGGGRARPPYPAVSRARLPDGRATPREGPRRAARGSPPPKSRARRPRRAFIVLMPRRSYHHRPPFSYSPRDAAALVLRTNLATDKNLED